jgi:hypothetical protein
MYQKMDVPNASIRHTPAVKVAVRVAMLQFPKLVKKAILSDPKTYTIGLKPMLTRIQICGYNFSN